VLVALQRQDEKLVNLTKAVKMYGKPLMEISGQTAELGATLAQTKHAVDAAALAVRDNFERLESRVAAGGTVPQELLDLAETAGQIAAGVAALAAKEGPTLDPVLEQTGRIETELSESGKRTGKLESAMTEFGKRTGSLETAIAEFGKRTDKLEAAIGSIGQQFEKAAQKAHDELQKLGGSSAQEATKQMQTRLDQATAKLTEGIAKMREDGLGGIETLVRELQREVGTVAKSVSQLQAAVKSGAQSMPAPATSQAPAPTAARAPAAAAPAKAAATEPAGAADGKSGYQTGAHASAGKNVLGAIAKLKRMKY
jgi:chromosome segregation ATPase